MKTIALLKFIFTHAEYFVVVCASTTDMDSSHKDRAARCGTEDFTKHLRKTHI